MARFASATPLAIKDVLNGNCNSMESNWQLNQALNPNNAFSMYSNFDIRHRIIANIGYRKSPEPYHGQSSFNVFCQYQLAARLLTQ